MILRGYDYGGRSGLQCSKCRHAYPFSTSKKSVGCEWLSLDRFLNNQKHGRLLSRNASLSEEIFIFGAPGQAWHLFRGESPRRARPSQPPVSSVADIGRRQCRATERNIRSVHRESCGPQGRPHSPKRFSLVTIFNAGGDGVK